jgi:putative acyl-CoA dehydrogenase
VICLDVMRGLTREPEAGVLLLAEIARAQGLHPALDAWLAHLQEMLARPGHFEANARRIVEDLALGLTASLLLRYAPAVLAEAFCNTRLGGDYGRNLGTLPDVAGQSEMIDRFIGIRYQGLRN